MVSSKFEVVKSQMAQLLILNKETVVSTVAGYSGVTVQVLDERAASKGNAIRNIECLNIEECKATAFLNSSNEEYRSLQKVVISEHYEHLNDLL